MILRSCAWSKWISIWLVSVHLCRILFQSWVVQWSQWMTVNAQKQVKCVQLWLFAVFIMMRLFNGNTSLHSIMINISEWHYMPWFLHAEYMMKMWSWNGFLFSRIKKPMRNTHMIVPSLFSTWKHLHVSMYILTIIHSYLMDMIRFEKTLKGWSVLRFPTVTWRFHGLRINRVLHTLDVAADNGFTTEFRLARPHWKNMARQMSHRVMFAYRY